uniref:Proteasome activator complex subunit 3 n=1 Tax=Stegastes partitus TaxID=144197 RepID=A0A3B4Z6Q0_9TELE
MARKKKWFCIFGLLSHVCLCLQVDAFRERITAEAEDLVANFFPKKLLELDHFLKDPSINITELKEIHSEINLTVPDPILLSNLHDGLEAQNAKKRKLEDGMTGTKVFVMPGGMMKSNGNLVELIEKVKPEIRTLIEKCNTVKMWVQLLIPRIEDALNIYNHLKDSELNFSVCMNHFFVVVVVVNQEDYRRTVTEIDEKEYISLKIIVSELRNQYVTLHDMILKNIEKIKRPRSSNTDALY